ncbi:tetratricopeptide repeat protein [Fodinibius salsisoli]|uniref:Tetratricopeptide repeat protein n=1 Tax=Fodinibius salsisoli TaxID=2820877 RepID=A0ABT3PMR8_9BACT|nr:tetratricopeptide repeat protein [Fodinibius salsisoli]MCW9707236.1 tetratricopeptide repeat protein [Fodinibius salsisoli]
MNRSYLLILIIGLSLGIGIAYSCTYSGEDSGSQSSAKSSPNQFVGDEACASCHADQTTSWKESHHDYAMKKATEVSVRGNFNNTTFTHNGDQYRFFQADSLFMVEAPGPDGNINEYHVTHTFGWTPLQQYLIDFGQGKLQALNIAWDTQKEEWFALNPEQDTQHGDWLHWTGGAMNWNTMCADCHSTNLQKNYIAEADSFHTTWSNINVSCEACHGPGKQHVDFVQSEEVKDATIERIREDLRLTQNTPQVEQINQCAQCHALREEVTGDYQHSGNFLDHYNPTLPHPDQYFADGQIRSEDYVYGSFLQSKMFNEGGVKCNDCHDPHSLELKANVTDNSLCMQCHEPRYNTIEHHKHQVNTEASQCINCHMPGRYYMEVDFRRDHSFRVPRPDLSAQFETPNACNNCHEDESAQWAADAVEEWYGPNRPDHFSETLVRADSVGADAIPQLKKLIGDTARPDIARATAVWYLGQFPDQQSMDILEQTLNDENPLVRNSSARTLASLPPEMKLPILQDALDDSVRAVRVAAAEGLAEFSAADITFNLKSHFNDALAEYKQYLNASQYFPQGQMNRGQYFEKQNQPQKAIDAYQKALQRDPYFNAARINLAYIYNGQGNNTEAKQLLETVIKQEPQYGPAHYSLALLLAEGKQLQRALSHFEKAATLMPANTRVRYNWAISLQQLNRPEEAEEIYLEAINIAPDNPEYRYGICTLYIQQKQYQKALPHAQKLVELQPQNSRFRQLLEMVKQQN